MLLGLEKSKTTSERRLYSSYRRESLAGELNGKTPEGKIKEFTYVFSSFNFTVFSKYFL